MMDDPLVELRGIVGDRSHAVTSCHTIAVPFRPSKMSPVVQALGRFLQRHSITDRTPGRNHPVGFVYSTPLGRADVQILGRVCWDELDAWWNEDFFEVTTGGIHHLQPKNAETMYPEYAGTHWGDKSYLVTPDDQT